MKKNLLLTSYVLKQREFKQILRIMKCTILLLFLLIFQANASQVSSQNARVNINRDQLRLKELMTEIEKQTDYLFIYSDAEINAASRVNVKKGTHRVADLLKEVLSKNNISYNFADNYISLHARKESQTDSAQGVQQKKNTINVSGTVVDPAGIPIIGVNIKLKGDKGHGTITDIDGNFKLEVPANGVLVLTYIGYKMEEVSVNGKTMFKVTMTEDAKALDEVVVTALGIKREEKALGYAIQKVGGDKINTVKTVDVGTALTGKVAGLNIENSTEFNTAPKLLLRGESPLLVIDGVPYGNVGLRDIAADDIESIDVLKGATASALYGARGGAGVVMITTKKGKEEGLHVSVNSSTMFQAGYLMLPEVQSGYSSGIGGKYNSDDFVWGDKLDIGRTAVQYDPFTHERVEMPLVSKGKNNFKNFLENSFVTNNNVSISQKGKYGSVRTSLTHVYNKGQYPNTKLNKISYSVSGDMKWKKFSFDGGMTYNKRFYPQNFGTGYGKGGYLYNLLVWTGPDYDVRDFKNYWVKQDEQQNWMYDGWYDNPYFIANEITRSSNYDIVNAYANMSYEFTSWLKATLRSGVDSYSERKEWQNPKSAHAGWDQNGYYEMERNGGFSMNHDVMLNASHKFGDFTVDGYVGGTMYYYYDDKVQGNTKGGLTIPGYYSLKASVDPASTSSTYKSKQVNSVWGRFSASWKSAVFLDVTGRNDWSSTLAADARSYFYPSISGSVVLSELFELPEWLSFWKVRGSWTRTKKDLSVYEINNVYSVSNDAWNGMSSASYPTSIRGSLIKPKTSDSWEIGTGINFFNNRLRLDFAYYNTLNYNLTRKATISSAAGFENTLINYDEEQLRRGVELTISGDIIQTRDWNWNAMFNWSRDRYFYDKVDKLYSTQKEYVAGGKRWDWLDVKDWERDPQGNIIHGADGLPILSDYPTLIGYEYPDWVWGMTNTLRYKDFTLSFTIDGRVGGLSYNKMVQSLWNTGAHPDSDNQWRYDEVVNNKINYIGKGVKVVSGTVERDADGKIVNDTRVFAPNDKEVSYQSYTRKYNPNAGSPVRQNYQLETFLKLRDLSVTYDMPKKYYEKLGLKGLSVSLVGQNLLIWTKEYKFSDPDVGSDDLNSPSIRNIGFNVKFNF